MLRIREERIAHYAVGVLPGALPLCKRPRRKHEFIPGDVPIAIVIKQEFVIGPGPREQMTVIQQHNVLIKIDRVIGFGLRLRPLDLIQHPPCKNIVLNRVCAPVIDVDPAAVRAVHHVILHRDVRGPFIQINAPAAVAPRIHPHIMHKIVVHNRVGRRSCEINPAHVAENALANMMHVIVFDHIIMTRALSIPHQPARRDTAISQIRNFIVSDVVVRRHPDPDAHRRRKQLPAIVHPIVIHRVQRCVEIIAINLKTASAQINRLIAPQFIRHTGVA